MIVDVSAPQIFSFNDTEFSSLVKWLQCAGKLIVCNLCEEKPTTAADLFTKDLAENGFARFVKPLRRKPLPSGTLPNMQSLSQHASRYIGHRRLGIFRRKRHLAKWPVDLSLRIVRELHIDPVFHLSPTFWQLAGERAWLDDAFRMEVAFCVEKTFAKRVLFRVITDDQEKAREYATVTFSPNAFWMLLAITCACGSTRGLSVPRKTIESFRKIAEDEELGRAGGYATLWDQWLLLEALFLLRQVRLPTSSRQAVALLPLRYIDDTQHTGPISDLAAPDWADNIPNWFRAWFVEYRQRDMKF